MRKGSGKREFSRSGGSESVRWRTSGGGAASFVGGLLKMCSDFV